MRFCCFIMILLQGTSLVHAQSSDTTVPAVPPAKAPAAGATGPDSSDYEIDYEEEPEGDTEQSTDQSSDASEGDEESPAASKNKKHPGKKVPPKSARKIVANDKNAPTSQGTRSKNRFAPMLKSDTKSVYKKNGKALDVDTD